MMMVMSLKGEEEGLEGDMEGKKESWEEKEGSYTEHILNATVFIYSTVQHRRVPMEKVRQRTGSGR